MANWRESEKQRRAEVEAGKTVVANIRKGADVQLVKWAKSQGKYVFIGRGQSGIGWGNPYIINKHGNRDRVCDDYINYFRRNNSLQSKVDSLKGKVLGCYCYPERCHGDYLASLANGGKRYPTKPDNN